MQVIKLKPKLRDPKLFCDAFIHHHKSSIVYDEKTTGFIFIFSASQGILRLVHVGNDTPINSPSYKEAKKNLKKSMDEVTELEGLPYNEFLNPVYNLLHTIVERDVSIRREEDLYKKTYMFGAGKIAFKEAKDTFGWADFKAKALGTTDTSTVMNIDVTNAPFSIHMTDNLMMADLSDADYHNYVAAVKNIWELWIPDADRRKNKLNAVAHALPGDATNLKLVLFLLSPNDNEEHQADCGKTTLAKILSLARVRWDGHQLQESYPVLLQARRSVRGHPPHLRTSSTTRASFAGTSARSAPSTRSSSRGSRLAGTTTGRKTRRSSRHG